MLNGYLEHGYRLLVRRWRGPFGEIDLVFEHSGEIVFVEVKSSRTHDRAIQSLTQRQISRLLRSAEHCLSYFRFGANTPMRFDVAAVDRAGRMCVIQNALSV